MAIIEPGEPAAFTRISTAATAAHQLIFSAEASRDYVALVTPFAPLRRTRLGSRISLPLAAVALVLRQTHAIVPEVCMVARHQAVGLSATDKNRETSGVDKPDGVRRGVAEQIHIAP